MCCRARQICARRGARRNWPKRRSASQPRGRERAWSNFPSLLDIAPLSPEPSGGESEVVVGPLSPEASGGKSEAVVDEARTDSFLRVWRELKGDLAHTSWPSVGWAPLGGHPPQREWPSEDNLVAQYTRLMASIWHISVGDENSARRAAARNMCYDVASYRVHLLAKPKTTIFIVCMSGRTIAFTILAPVWSTSPM